MVHLLPLTEGETIATILPLPEEESTWSDLVAVFATAEGLVRPISLSKFDNILSTGIIAIKLREGDRLIGVTLAAANDDILLVARGGKCIRFAMEGVRLMGGRSTAGVRGMALKSGDEVISMSVLQHLEVDADERQAYLQSVAARRRLGITDYEGKDKDRSSDTKLAARLEEPDFLVMAQREQFILSLTENGFGKRSSSYEYRTTNRGGSGIINIETSERNGPVVASFPVSDRDDIMLVTDRGKLIRIPVGDIRIAGRNTQGVIVFKTGEEEKVVSAAHLGEDDSTDESDEEGAHVDEVAEGSRTDTSSEEE